MDGRFPHRNNCLGCEGLFVRVMATAYFEATPREPSTIDLLQLPHLPSLPQRILGSHPVARPCRPLVISVADGLPLHGRHAIIALDVIVAEDDLTMLSRRIALILSVNSPA